MNIIIIDRQRADQIAPLMADFRVALCAFRGIETQPDLGAAHEELKEYLDRGYPVFAAEDHGQFIGFVVCRIDEPCLWVESLFVRREYRRQGVASMLFHKAEELAEAMGEDTVFNFVHPNNEGIIRFLRAKGYTVLNMIEIRKPYKNEELRTTIRVGNNAFDY
jgi:Acetyltransferases